MSREAAACRAAGRWDGGDRGGEPGGRGGAELGGERGTPVRAHLAQGPGRSLGLAGVEVGLPGEAVAGAGGRVVAVLLAVGADQLAVPGLYLGAAAWRRTRGTRPGTPVISRTGSAFWPGPGPCLERGGVPGGGEAGGQLGLEPGVVVLRGRHGHPVQGPGVQRPPQPVGPADLRGDHHVGVQVRVTGAGVVVVEHGHRQAPGGELGDAALPRPGQRGVLLQHRQRGVPRRLMRGPDRRAHRRPVIDGPDQRGGLDRGEHDIEPGDGGPCPAGLGGLDLLQLSRRDRAPGGLGERGGPPGDPPGERGQGLVGGERHAERRRGLGLLRGCGQLAGAHLRGDVIAQVPGDDLLGPGVHAHAEQGLHLRLGHLPGDPQQRRSRARPTGPAGCPRRCSSPRRPGRAGGARHRRRSAG